MYKFLIKNNKICINICDKYIYLICFKKTYYYQIKIYIYIIFNILNKNNYIIINLELKIYIVWNMFFCYKLI